MMGTAGSFSSLSHFQEECREALEALFSKKRLTVSSEVVQGNHEIYVVMRLAQAEKLEVFIYKEGGRFFLGKDWHPSESVDFNSSSELIENLVSKIGQVLVSSGA